MWKEKFEFPRVNQKEHFIIFEVFDEHRVTKDNCIGGIKVKLKDHRIEVCARARARVCVCVRARVCVCECLLCVHSVFMMRHISFCHAAQCKKANIVKDVTQMINAPLHKRNSP